MVSRYKMKIKQKINAELKDEVCFIDEKKAQYGVILMNVNSNYTKARTHLTNLVF